MHCGGQPFTYAGADSAYRGSKRLVYISSGEERHSGAGERLRGRVESSRGSQGNRRVVSPKTPPAPAVIMAAVPTDVLVERLRGRENAKRLVSSSFMCNKMFQVRVGRYYTKYDVCNTGQPGRGRCLRCTSVVVCDVGYLCCSSVPSTDPTEFLFLVVRAVCTCAITCKWSSDHRRTLFCCSIAVLLRRSAKRSCPVTATARRTCRFATSLFAGFC